MAGVYGSLCNIGAPGFSALVAAVFVSGVFGCCGVRSVVAGLLLCFGAFTAHAFTGPRDGGTVQLFGGAVDTGAFGNVVGVFPSGQLQQCDEIGRASCRERVEMWVVGGAVKHNVVVNEERL